MKIVLTGGAGFIGSHIADLLISEGHKVAIVDDLSSGTIENIPPEAAFYQIDIRDPSVGEILQREAPEVIIHHAAQISVRCSVEDPIHDLEINIRGTLNLLQGAVQHNVKKFIFASTGGAIYGEQDYFPADEEHPQRPISPYGVGKLAVEKYLYCYYTVYGLSYTVLRYSNVYGPRQDPHGEAGVVAIFALKMLDKGNPVINGTGEQTRDFVYVKDVARANLLAINSNVAGAINIGTAQETSVNQLFSLLAGLTGSQAPQPHAPPIPGEQLRSVISWERARTVLGWSPQVALEAGLSETVDFFKAARGKNSRNNNGFANVKGTVAP
jgi:UDP-glucose 4-epimerase